MSKKLFVGNLPETSSEYELFQLFRPFNSLTAKVPLDSDGYPRGFGFVRVPDETALDAIRKMDGTKLEDRSLTVEEAAST
jgi:RNA recognition motif-containing protein